MYRGDFYPADKLVGSAIAGIDIALWYIKGKVLGIPVYELLGGRCRKHVQCFLNPEYLNSQVEQTKDIVFKKVVEENDIDIVAEHAKRYCAKGFKYFRLFPESEKKCI